MTPTEGTGHDHARRPAPGLGLSPIGLCSRGAPGLVAALCLALLMSDAALAKPANGGTEAALGRCAELTDPAERLACFDALAVRTKGLSRAAGPTTGEPPPLAEGPEPPAETPAREPFGIRPYRANYLLPVAYNANPNRNLAPAESLDLPFLEGALDDVEMKFQLSFEVPLWTRLLHRDLDLYFAYTQLAFFQAYNREYSAPFRETNYEPELGLNWEPDVAARGWRLKSARLALNHESNGRSQPLSRSWNRLLLQVQGGRDDLELGLRLWLPLDDEPSDNPDITDYLGYGELHAAYRLGQHRLGLLFRNPQHPSLQLDWSYPLSRTIKLYLQYFNGYGESLLDYDHSVNRIGLGFKLNHWP